MHLFGDDDENYQENATAGPSAAAGQSPMFHLLLVTIVLFVFIHYSQCLLIQIATERRDSVPCVVSIMLI